MFGEKLLIKKYPYLGDSQNLIEYFSVIGYTENFIPELISAYKLRQNIPTNTSALSQILYILFVFIQVMVNKNYFIHMLWL